MGKGNYLFDRVCSGERRFEKKRIRNWVYSVDFAVFLGVWGLNQRLWATRKLSKRVPENA